MELRTAASPKDVKYYDTTRLREEFLIEKVFYEDEIYLVYSHIDRIITGSAMPVSKELKLEAGDELRAKYFLERREMGVINIGGAGTITIDGKVYKVAHREGMYIGMGAKDILFASDDASKPAKFYIKVESCQLEMGMTHLEPGSVWNTMPSHTHDRRMEVYLYFEIPEDSFVMHFMGEPTETRHIIMHNEQAVISPSWSIHSGCGSRNYTFIWGMVGENQDFDDMDNIANKDLR